VKKTRPWSTWVRSIVKIISNRYSSLYLVHIRIWKLMKQTSVTFRCIIPVVFHLQLNNGSFESKHNCLMFLSPFKLTTCFGYCAAPSSVHKIYNWGEYTAWITNKVVWNNLFMIHTVQSPQLYIKWPEDGPSLVKMSGLTHIIKKDRLYILMLSSGWLSPAVW